MIKSGVGKILDYILDFPQLVLKQCIFVSLACECDADGTLSGGLCVSYSDPATRSVVDQCLAKGMCKEPTVTSASTTTLY